MQVPLYTANKRKAAYQLNWCYSIFWHTTPYDFSWFDALKVLNEKDGIRVLQHQFDPPNVSKFLISTRPDLPPIRIAQRVKGRLQHLLRDRVRKPFRRNYSLRSIGSTRRDKLEHYLATQLDHHPLADPRMQARLRKYQIHCPEVDLSQPRKNNYALYWYNLHVILENEDGWVEVRDEVLQNLHDEILKVSIANEHWLLRAALPPNHIHLMLGCHLEESPQDVALSYMNNLANACGRRPVFRPSYYVGTFGEYDLGVIPRPCSAESCVPPSKLDGDAAR